MKKLTEKIVKERILSANKNISFPSTFIYKSVDLPVDLYCTKHNLLFKQTPYHAFRGECGCKICKENKLRESQFHINNEIFKKTLNKKYDNLYSLIEKDEIKNTKQKVEIYCNKHNLTFKTSYDKIITAGKTGCKCCSSEKIIKEKTKYDTEQFIKKAKKIHGDKYDYSKVIFNKITDYVNIICPKHGEFKQIAHNHLQGHGCPFCQESHIENELAAFFNKNNLKYIRQCTKKEFKWLNRQSFDFYLPDYNIAIECQGIQHFESINFFNGEDGFNLRKKRDDKKLKLSITNGVTLLYFTHYDKIDENGDIYKDKDHLLKRILNESKSL